MVMAAVKNKHAHKFEVDSHGKGSCPCGEVREYMQVGPLKDLSYTVLQAGDPNYQEPTVLASAFSQPAIKIESPITEKRGGRFEKFNYYLDNKEAILADVKALGRHETIVKWQIPNTTMHSLLKRWGELTKKTTEKPAIIPQEIKLEPQSSLQKKYIPIDLIKPGRQAIDELIKYWKMDLPNETTNVDILIISLTIAYLENYKAIMEACK